MTPSEERRWLRLCVLLFIYGLACGSIGVWLVLTRGTP